MSDRERSRSPSASERKVTISSDQSPVHSRQRDRDNHDSPSRNNKIVKRSYSRSPDKMSYNGDRGRGGEERGDRGDRDRSGGERGERGDRGERSGGDRGDRGSRYNRASSRSRSRSPKRYKSSRYSHSRSRSHSRGRGYGRRDRSHSRSPMSSRRRHVGTRDNPKPSRCLGVFGLSINTTESELHHIFSKYGPVENVQIIIDSKTGQSRGFCFVYYESVEDSKVAKEQCNGIKIGGKNIRVDYSITQRAHTPTPGIYMGKPTYMSSRMGWGDRGGRPRDRDDYYSSYRGSYRDRRSPSPYYSSSSRRRRYERSRSRSYSPREYYSKSSRY